MGKNVAQNKSGRSKEKQKKYVRGNERKQNEN